MPDGGVVITGSAGGVGFAYAGEFMDRGYDVVICDVKDCTTAAKALSARHPNGNVYHTKCDVSDASSCEKLGQFAYSGGVGNVGEAFAKLCLQMMMVVIQKWLPCEGTKQESKYHRFVAAVVLRLWWSSKHGNGYAARTTCEIIPNG